jgi:predicted nuclease of restriction endonuclease-like (RecB) superfamily
MVLEFLGLRRETAYYEKDLESAIITHLQDFIQELGYGFCFEHRQKRLLFDDEYLRRRWSFDLCFL